MPQRTETTSGGAMTITATAARLGCSYRAVTDMIRRGELSAIYTGARRIRARLVSVAEIERYERKCKGGVRHASHN